MKLFPSKKKGRHLKQKGTVAEAGKKKKGLRSLNLGVKIAIGSIAGLTALALGAAVYLKLSAAPPDVVKTPSTPPVNVIDPDASPTPTKDPNEPEVETNGIRDEKKYTFLVLGTDDGNGNTDVIMLATLDTRDYTLNVVNIPRDTLVNVSWSVKKVNSIYSVMKNKGTEEDEFAGVREKFAAFIGYEVDFYVVVDLDAFAALVDAVGGIYFDVPRNMDYDDPAQNLHVKFAKGPQTLSGKQALQVVRWRQNNDGSGYATGDIGRIETTQKFLLAAAAQILENKSSIGITSIANIFLKYVNTDLTLNEVIWFAQELFKLDAENISFDLLPANTNDSVNGDSYVTIYVNEWLELINKKLNPFYVDITLENVSIYTRGADKKLYTTNGVYEGKQSWGNSGGSSSGGGSSASTPTPTVTPDVSETPANTDEGPIEVTDAPVTDNPGTTNPTEETTTVPEIPENTPLPPATPPDDGGSLFYTGTI